MPTGMRTSRTGCRRSSAWCAASSTAPRPSPTTSSACSSSSSASRIWEAYLKGEEADPKAAMQKIVDAVQAEIKRGMRSSRVPVAHRPALEPHSMPAGHIPSDLVQAPQLRGAADDLQHARRLHRGRAAPLQGISPWLFLASGPGLLRRLPGLPDRPRRLDQLHRLRVPVQRAGQLGRACTTTSQRSPIR